MLSIDLLLKHPRNKGIPSWVFNENYHLAFDNIIFVTSKFHMNAQHIYFQQKTTIKHDSLNDRNELTGDILAYKKQCESDEYILSGISDYKEMYLEDTDKHLLNTLRCKTSVTNYIGQYVNVDYADSDVRIPFFKYSFDLIVRSITYKCLAIYPNNIYILVDSVDDRVFEFTAKGCEAFIFGVVTPF
jgi:hypothetical protein